jgi:hypothetical protein
MAAGPSMFMVADQLLSTFDHGSRLTNEIFCIRGTTCKA